MDQYMEEGRLRTHISLNDCDILANEVLSNIKIDKIGLVYISLDI